MVNGKSHHSEGSKIMYFLALFGEFFYKKCTGKSIPSQSHPLPGVMDFQIRSVASKLSKKETTQKKSTPPLVSDCLVLIALALAQHYCLTQIWICSDLLPH